MANMNINNGCKERNCLDRGVSFFERNNYFCGKMMVDRDFWADQLYHLRKQRLHTSYLHGWGTVCGLRVLPHPHCPNLKVIVKPGLAIDCWGREIFVPDTLEVELESYRSGDGSGADKPKNLYISLCYRECETEPVPVFLDECGCSESCEPNRIRETFAIAVLTPEDFEEGELDGYKFHRIVSAEEVEVTPTTELKEFDGEIWIKTLYGTFHKKISEYGSGDTVQKLIDEINAEGLNLKFEFSTEKSRLVLTAEKQGDVMILEESGEKPFFSKIGFPAIRRDKGNRIIESCPACDEPQRIILAEITGYENVDDTTHQYLDPSEGDFKIPAYTVDNFSYRKTLPSIEFLNRMMIYNTYIQP